MSDIQTRAGDPSEANKRLERVRGEGRRRTIVYSAFVAGLVSLAFAYWNDYDQVTRSRDNCEFIQSDRRDRAESLRETAFDQDRQADFVLGDPTHKDPKTGKLDPIQPANWNEQPFKSYAKFKPLVIQQSNEARKLSVKNYQRADDIIERIEHCDDVFPRPDIPIIPGI